MYFFSFELFHTFNFTFKKSDLTIFLIPVSESYDFRGFSDGNDDAYKYFNKRVHFVQNVESLKYNHIRIVLGTLDWDICRNETCRFSQFLNNKNIRHW